MRCPNCGHENIAGEDLCEVCGSDLAGLDLPEAESGFRGRLLTDRIGDLPLVSPIFVQPEMSVAEAIEQMRRHRQGCVLVREEGKLAGIFTERDVLVRVVRPGLDPRQVRISEVMTPDPVSLQASDPPAFAVHLSVERGLRHMPVMKTDRLVGLVSVRQLLRHIHEDVLGRK